MKNTYTWAVLATALGLSLATPSNAALISVSGPNSSAGTAAAIIAAPTSVLEDGAMNSGMQGFDEMQGVVLSQDYDTDQGLIEQGLEVDSHMIFMNSSGNARVTHVDLIWTFDGIILGVMSDHRGRREAASSAELGAPGTNYLTPSVAGGSAAPFSYRGLEPFDRYEISGNQLRIRMRVSEPGDWIRVVTASPGGEEVPEPGTIALFGAGLVGVAWIRRKRAA